MPPMDSRLAIAVEALEKCRAQFDQYATLHKAKRTGEGDAKAATNAALAFMCSEARAALKASEPLFMRDDDDPEEYRGLVHAARLLAEAEVRAELFGRACEYVHHEPDCPSFSSGQDGDCTCGAVAFLDELEAVLKPSPAPVNEEDRLREALKPFASFATDNTEEDPTHPTFGIWSGNRCERERIIDWFGPTDFYRARQALEPTPATGGEHDR